MSTTLMQASQQWSTRPDDERYLSLTELAAATAHMQANSRQRVISSRGMTVAPLSVADDPKQRGLVAVGPNGGQAAITNWAFGQLCQRGGAPAGYLRSLPAPMAADCVNFGLQVTRDIDELGILIYQNGGPPELRAVTGPNYGRVWNADICSALLDRFGDGLTGDFRIPGEFGPNDNPITKQNTTLYASDRDMFVFLADEEHRIEMPNRRNGETGSLARGFFVWNSEVGAQAFGVSTFLFDYMCGNHIVWGVEGYKEIRMRHTSGAPDRWAQEVVPALREYSRSSTAGITQALENARKARIDDVSDFLAKRFTKTMATQIQAAHLAEEHRPIETLWDVATGITAHAKSIAYMDERIKIERQAGLILDMAN